MEEDMAGTIVEANDGRRWFCGDLGWYLMPIDSEAWPIEDVPGGIARVIEDARRWPFAALRSTETT